MSQHDTDGESTTVEVLEQQVQALEARVDALNRRINNISADDPASGPLSEYDGRHATVVASLEPGEMVDLDSLELRYLALTGIDNADNARERARNLVERVGDDDFTSTGFGRWKFRPGGSHE